MMGGIEAVKTCTVAEAIVDCLKQEGVRYIFGLPGSQILELLDAVHREPELRFVLTRHEANAAFMAHGYALSSHSAAVCLATHGPGATNLLTGIAAAYKASAPVIALTGKAELDVHQRDFFQEIDEVSLFRPITKWSCMVTRAQQAPDIVRKAFRIALSGRPGPVHINIPVNLLRETISYPPLSPERYRAPEESPLEGLNDALAARVLASLEAARFPVVLAGGEILRERATPLLLELAEALSLPVVTTINHLDAFPAVHPLGLGPIGKNGWDCANRAIATADLLLALGAHFDFLSTNFSRDLLAPDTKIVHVSAVPERIGLIYPVESGVLSPTRPFLADLVRRVKGKPAREADPRPAAWKREWLAKRARWGEARETPIKPQYAAYSLHGVVPDDALYVLDGGNFAKFVRKCCDTREGGTFLNAEDFGTVGSGFPLALGAKMGQPSRTAVCVLGDGAFMMTLGELETAVREGIDVVAVVFNDSGFGNIRSYQHAFFDRRYIGCDFSNPNFGDIARLFGGWGTQVRQPEELEGALRQAFGVKGLAVVDVLVDPYALAAPTHQR